MQLSIGARLGLDLGPHLRRRAGHTQPMAARKSSRVDPKFKTKYRIKNWKTY
jgi:hypothetical protein